MPLINLILILGTVGFLLWLVNKYIPMQPTIKTILNGAVVVGVILWLLSVFGLLAPLNTIHIGH